MISDKLNYLKDTKSAIKNAINSKGVNVTNNTPFRDYANKINLIEQGEGSGSISREYEWVRPVDRPAIPILNENEIYILYGVMPTGLMNYSISLTSTNGFTVDWGDENVERIDSTDATIVNHIYDYSTLTVKPNSVGIKFIWIKITGNFTTILTDVYPAPKTTQSIVSVYEIHLNAPNVVSWSWPTSASKSMYYHLEILNWEGTNKLTSLNYFLSYCKRLKLLKMSTTTVTNFNFFLSNCSSINCPLEIDTSNGTIFTNAFSTLETMSFPLIINLLNATTAIGTNFIAGACRSLPSVRLLNMGAIHNALNLNTVNFNAEAVIDLFNDLYDRSNITVGTVYLNSVYGLSNLTLEQKAIAVNKNWTITG